MAFNPLQNYLGGLGAGQQQVDRQNELDKQSQIKQLSGTLSQSSQPMLEPEFQKLVEVDPVRAKQIIDVAAGGDALRANAMLNDAKNLKHLLNIKDFSGAENLLSNRKRLIQGDSGDTDAVLGMVKNQDYQGAMNAVDSYLGLFDPNASKDKSMQKQPDTAEIKNFNKLDELRKSGTPEQVAAFEKMTGLISDPKMSSNLEKQIVSSQDDFFKFSEQARQMNVLASDIQQRSIGGGLQSTLSETFKSILGSQDEVTNLRRRFNAIRTSQATTNLPPGPASDKDIQLALSGFPAENANAEVITSFLRGQEKLAKVNEKFAEFKADFYAVNKSPSGLLPAWKNYAANTKLFEDSEAANPAPSPAPQPSSGFKILSVN